MARGLSAGDFLDVAVKHSSLEFFTTTPRRVCAPGSVQAPWVITGLLSAYPQSFNFSTLSVAATLPIFPESESSATKRTV